MENYCKNRIRGHNAIEKELNEIKVIEMFLPKQIDEDETILIIKNIIQENNYTSLKEMGAIMKIIKEKYTKKLSSRSSPD